MAKGFIAGLISLSLIHPSYSMQVSDSAKLNQTNSTVSVYLEVLGNGGFFSGNAEYIISNSNKTRGVFIRAGYGTGGESRLIPFEIGIVRGANRKFLDISIGFTGLIEEETNSFDKQAFFLPVVRIGYRYQGKNGLLFRIAPLFIWWHDIGDDYFVPWLGVSLGYSFSAKGRN